MRLLVTGGTGFLGRFVVPRLVAAGHDVTCIVRRPEAEAQVARWGAAAALADLNDPVATMAAFSGARPEALVNLASLGFGHAPTIVGAADACGARGAVYVSTTAVTTALAAPSKRIRLEAERTVQGGRTPWTIIRPTMIYGAPGDRNMERLLGALRRLRVFPLPGGRRLHQPVHVDDLAATIVNAIDRPAAVGRTYDVAGPEPLSFRRLAQDAGRSLGRRVLLVPVPARPLLVGAQALERHGRRGPVSSEQLARLLEDKAFDNGPAQGDLGHLARPFSEGIAAEAMLLGLRP